MRNFTNSKNSAGIFLLQSFCLFVCFLFQGTIISSAQQWENTFGDAGRQRGYKMIETYDNGFAILGLNNVTLNNSQINLIKTDIDGNILWNKQIGSTLFFNASVSLNITHDGGFILSGYTTQYDSMGAAFVLKLDECGEKQWCKIYGTFNVLEEAAYVHQLQDGNYIFCARYFRITSQNERVGLIKLDSFGNVIWYNDYSHYGVPDAFSLLLSNDNGFLISGDCYAQNLGDSTGPYWLRALVIKVDSTGNEQWNIPFGIATTPVFLSRGGSTREFPDGSFLTLCTRRVAGSPYLNYSYLFKTDAGGNVLWGKQIGDSIINGEWDLDILALNDTESVTLSQIWDTASTNVINYKILKVNSAGNILDSATYGYTDTGFDGKLSKTRDEKILVCTTKYMGGSNYDIYALKLNADLQLDTIYNIFLNYDSLCSTQITTGTITLDTMSYVGIEEETPAQGEFLIYPNPVSDNLTIEISSNSSEKKYLSIYNILGEEVLKQNFYSQKYSIDVSNLARGVYIVEVQGRKNIAREKIIKK